MYFQAQVRAKGFVRRGKGPTLFGWLEGFFRGLLKVLQGSHTALLGLTKPQGVPPSAHI